MFAASANRGRARPGKEKIRDKKAAPAVGRAALLSLVKMMTYFTASFNPFPALKTGTFLAAILIASPVWGFLPLRAFLLLTEKVPNPTNVTVSPFLRAFWIAANVAVTAASASFLVHVAFATSSINSALFIGHPFKNCIFGKRFRKAISNFKKNPSFFIINNAAP